MSGPISGYPMPESASRLLDDIHAILAPAAKRLVARLTAESIREETLDGYLAMTGKIAPLQTGVQWEATR